MLELLIPFSWELVVRFCFVFFFSFFLGGEGVVVVFGLVGLFNLALWFEVPLPVPCCGITTSKIEHNLNYSSSF